MHIYSVWWKSSVKKSIKIKNMPYIVLKVIFFYTSKAFLVQYGIWYFLQLLVEVLLLSLALVIWISTSVSKLQTLLLGDKSHEWFWWWGKIVLVYLQKVHCEPSRRAQYFRLFPQNVLRQTPQDVTVEHKLSALIKFMLSNKLPSGMDTQESST